MIIADDNRMREMGVSCSNCRSGGAPAGSFLTTTTMLIMMMMISTRSSSSAVVLVVGAFVATRVVPVSRHQQHLQSPNIQLFGSKPADLDISFGSSENNPSSSSGSGGGGSGGTGSLWGDNPDQENADQEARAARVAELLEESDRDFRQLRKAKKWGKFANVTRASDLQPLLEEEREKIRVENEIKARMAAVSGVALQILEPKQSLVNGNGSSQKVFEENGNVQISSGSKKSWFSEMDEDIQAEWEALTSSRSLRDKEDSDYVHDDDDNDNNNTDDDVDGDDLSAAYDVTVDGSTGQMVARDALAGVRVGSAGGWSLEVFPGDFVVHRRFGIGRFEKTCLRPKTKLTPEERQARDERRAEILTQELRKRKRVTADEIQEIRSQFGTETDMDPISNPQTTVLEIAYADAVVHVPVDRAYRLSRYRAGDAIVKPKLSRVKGDAWARAKRNVEENTIKLAQDVLALYTTRETLQRNPFDPLKETLVEKFEETFPYEPTPDQIKCFEDVENDMVWRSRPMDRLVCGDVGFGKTEVAMRALYRAAANGRQGALLAPTGVLAAQHYKNVVKRMGPGTPFNMTIALFRGGMSPTTKAGRAMRDTLKMGEAQIVVGTHALLGKDIQFKDLGLLVVDEEQRFGVKQKERLKLICNGIDVLTLSATPIPRTLQMSLSGIRDTSTIRSPPPMRKPTISYVQDFSESMVKDAISRELARGGQCYYVVPRIALIDEAQSMIERLFPGIRVIQAHGQMQRNGAEDNVAAFAEGNYDVLLATTVIENGVDIPTTNTIIVQDSQIFGMSTLYQLRGRVGRSDKQAYAYFLHREETITEQAAMRLQAIGELSELGSGFDVANRDLEIRGAGSLLGTEQSGMAARVGFDLYMRMLKKSIRELRGLDLPLVPRTNILIPTDGTPSTFSLPKKLIPDDETRHREEVKARLAESTAKLVNLTNSWKEYGDLSAKLQSQLKTLHLHACTRRLGIDLVGLVDKGDGNFDCVLRSPGFRPRHWAIILEQFPRRAAPKGLDVCFPARFTLSGLEETIEGGKKVDLSRLVSDDSSSEDSDDEAWDAIDQEEVEAMKQITSAVNVKSMDEIDLGQYPRFVVRDVGSGKVVDRLLKFLLPIAKIVYEQQENQAEQAKAAADLREKQELLRSRKKANEEFAAQRMDYL